MAIKVLTAGELPVCVSSLTSPRHLVSPILTCKRQKHWNTIEVPSHHMALANAHPSFVHRFGSLSQFNHQALAMRMNEITPKEQELGQCLGSSKVDERG